MKNICIDCGREIPDEFFEKETPDDTKYDPRGNGFCGKCIYEATLLELCKDE